MHVWCNSAYEVVACPGVQVPWRMSPGRDSAVWCFSTKVHYVRREPNGGGVNGGGRFIQFHVAATKSLATVDLLRLPVP